MNDYKYATDWLGYVSRSPAQEYGGFNRTTVEGATVALREMHRLKRENTLMHRFFSAKTWPERNTAFRIIKSKLPGMFGRKDGK